jgi:ferritin-like metal-binding protein YciE
MQTAHELFLHELSDMLDGEEKLIQALGEHEQEASRPELKKAFASHRAQTQKQAQRLRQIFEDLGEQPKETDCKGIKGLIEEHEALKDEDPSPDLLDIGSVGGAIKVERYEISTYESLLQLARDMKHTDAVKLLSQNLKEEQETLRKMESFSKKLKPEQSGMEEIEEETTPSRRRAASGRRRRAA